MFSMTEFESGGNLRPDLSQRHNQFTRDYAITRDSQGRIICDLPDPSQLMLSSREPRYSIPQAQRAGSENRLAHFIWNHDGVRNALAVGALGVIFAFGSDQDISSRGFLQESLKMTAEFLSLAYLASAGFGVNLLRLDRYMTQRAQRQHSMIGH